MKEKLHIFFYIIIIFLYLNQISCEPLSFKFHIISKPYPPKYNLKSLLELDRASESSESKQRMCLEFCFGTPKACHLLTIHSQSFLIWVMDSRANILKKEKLIYDATKSTTGRYNQSIIEISLDEDKILKGNVVHDRIYTSDNFLFRGFFLSVISSNHYIDEGMIGLGYRGHPFEERYSFINQLFSNGLIYHKVFTQSFKNDENGVMSFGEIPKEIVNNYKKYGRCFALNKEINGVQYKNRKWECKIDGIYFGDIYDEKFVYKLENSRASFFSFRKRALVPKDIFKFFANSYFGELIKNEFCERIFIGKYDTIRCKGNNIEGPKINLIFGDWSMSIPINELITFNKKTNNYEFIFYNKKKFDHWSLGRPVVRLFHMVYDYQNQEIGFYSEKNVNYINKELEPSPPKIYEKLTDREELVDDYENNDPNLVEENEENIKRRKQRKTTGDIVEDIKKESGINEKTVTKTVSNAIIIQNAFKIFLIFVIICFIGFAIFLFYRHKRKMEILKSDYFLQKANELNSNKI